MVFAVEFLGVILEISLYLNQESSKTLLIAFIFAGYLELGLIAVGPKLGDFSIGLVKKLLELYYRDRRGVDLGRNGWSRGTRYYIELPLFLNYNRNKGSKQYITNRLP
jgi:hypothetical protein